MTASRTIVLFLALGLSLALASCGGSSKFEVADVTFCHGLTENMEAEQPGDTFRPDETVYLSVTLKGRPKQGTVSAKFYYGDEFIAEASVDLGDVNSGVLFSVGESTFVGYTLTHENPFPIGDEYRAELFHDDEPIGKYPFRVMAGN
ncbi:MAG: hypothetical protein JW889_10815 [Verrucomicrobia bacterium]|nr:hypothetical protein [Verrucomicrobiota bacterium]